MNLKRRFIIRATFVFLLFFVFILPTCLWYFPFSSVNIFMEGNSDKTLSGPWDGDLKHEEDGYIEVYDSEVNVKNFATEAKFFNPYSADKNWDYGFLFRYVKKGTFQTIRVTSWGTWYHDVVMDGKWKEINKGELTNLRTEAGQNNNLRIEIIGKSGKFYVNGTFITSLDVSGLMQGGTVKIASGTISGCEIEGEVTKFKDFAVWLWETGSIKVLSKPTGTKCYLSEDFKGITPLAIKDVYPGSYTITLKKEDYKSETKIITVYSQDTTNVNITLEKELGSIRASSNINGAFMYMDGIYKGMVPLKLNNIPTGNHLIRISADKYFDYTKWITVDANRTTYIEANLEEKPGSIKINSIPSRADVYLDGTHKGETPITIFHVESGTYALTLKHQGYKDWAKSVDVYPDEESSVDVSMQKIFWRTWYFSMSVISVIVILFCLILWSKRRYIISVSKSSNLEERIQKFKQTKNNLDEMLSKELISQEEHEIAKREIEKKLRRMKNHNRD